MSTRNPFDPPHPDATNTLGDAPAAAHSKLGDLRIIPVETETTFVIGPDDTPNTPIPYIEDLAPPEAVLLDAGDLIGVEEVLTSLGVDTQRIESDTARDLTWPSPSRLLVASGSLALGLSLRDVREHGHATLAVSDEESRGFAHRMREQGFQYVVNQPIHLDVLRLLLQQTLLRRPHPHHALRHPSDQPVTWRRGHRRREATLVELSSLGGRLHVAHPAALEAPVTLRVLGPDAQPPPTLRGRVVRCDRRLGAGRRYALGVAWELTSAAERQTLDVLLTSPGRQVGRATAAPSAARPGRGLGGRRTATRPPRRPSDLALPDRRKVARGELDQEIVALDTENRVCTTLFGRDLSTRALRVEDGTGFDTGQPLRIAIHTARGEDPLVIDSVVVRDDDTQGRVLGFLEISPEEAQRLQRVVDKLPPIDSTRSRPWGTP